MSYSVEPDRSSAQSLQVILEALIRRKNLAILIAVPILIVGSLAILAWPDTYRSTAVILIERPDVPENLVQTTVTTFASQQVQYITQRVMTRANLAKIIEKYDLYSEAREEIPATRLTAGFRRNISMDLVNVELTNPNSNVPIIDTIAFTLGFQSGNPNVAQQVAEELVDLYLEENVRARTAQTAETTEFLSEEVAKLDEEVRRLEKEVASFKENNRDSLPELTGLNLEVIQRTRDELLQVRRQLDSVTESRILLDAQLAQISPLAPTVLPDGTTAVDPASQLKALQSRLAMLQGKYGPDHPDVLRTQREISALQKETGITSDLAETRVALADARTDLALARERYGNEHPEVLWLERQVSSLEQQVLESRAETDALIQPDNPAYIQVKAQRDTLAAQETAYRRQELELRQQLQDYEQNLRKSPQVEQELSALERQLETATERYVAIRERQFGARMGQSLESQSKGERFVLLEKPQFPLRPFKPNRQVLFLILVFFSVVVALGSVQVVEYFDHSIWGGRAIQELQGAPPIAEIPIIMTIADENRRHKRRLVAIAGAVPVMALIAALFVHMSLMPLDELWIKIIQ